MSPGPIRSPTDISLAQLVHIPSNEDVGEGTSRAALPTGLGLSSEQQPLLQDRAATQEFSVPPPEYSSPQHSPDDEAADELQSAPRAISPRPPVPSYDDAMGQTPERQLELGSRRSSQSESDSDTENSSDS